MALPISTVFPLIQNPPIIPHYQFNLNSNINPLPLLPAASDADYLWETIRGQLTRFNRVIAIPQQSYDAMISAFDGNVQAAIFKENYTAHTGKIPLVCELHSYPGWIFMLPKDLVQQLEVFYQASPQDTLTIRNRFRPVVLVGLADIENRSHGPFPEFGILSYDSEESSDNKNRDKIPRPRNPWIVYRQYKSKLYQDNPNPDTAGMSIGQLSTYISKAWSEEPAAMKAFFQKIADDEKAAHQQRYPGYIYQPRKPAEKKKRMSKKKAKLEYDASQNGPILSIKDQKRIHQTAIKYRVIATDTDFVARILAFETTQTHDLSSTTGISSSDICTPLEDLDFNSFPDGFWDGHSN